MAPSHCDVRFTPRKQTMPNIQPSITRNAAFGFGLPTVLSSSGLLVANLANGEDP